MNPMNNYTPVTLPLSDLLQRNNVHDANYRTPPQLRDTLAQPAPKGWDKLHKPEWKPRNTKMFSTRLPRSVDDACAYVREMQYPFPKAFLFVWKYVGKAVLVFLGLFVLATPISLGMSTDTVAILAIIFFMLSILSVGIIAVTTRTTFKFEHNIDLKDQPTPRMAEIEERSVKDVFDLSIPAFDVFCYDTQHYNAFIELYDTLSQSYAQACKATDNKAEETRTACKKILTDWLYTSSFRQDVTKRARIETAKQQQVDTARHKEEDAIIARDFDSAYATALLEVLGQQKQQQ